VGVIHGRVLRRRKYKASEMQILPVRGVGYVKFYHFQGEEWLNTTPAGVVWEDTLTRAAMASGTVSDNGLFLVVFGDHFAGVRHFVIQPHKMSCLTVRFHAYSLIQFNVSRTSPVACRAKYNLINDAVQKAYRTVILGHQWAKCNKKSHL